MANIGVKWNEFFGGFLAFRNGIAVRTRERKIKVFRTAESAMKAAQKSKIVAGYRQARR